MAGQGTSIEIPIVGEGEMGGDSEVNFNRVNVVNLVCFVSGYSGFSYPDQLTRTTAVKGDYSMRDVRENTTLMKNLER